MALRNLLKYGWRENKMKRKDIEVFKQALREVLEERDKSTSDVHPSNGKTASVRHLSNDKPSKWELMRDGFYSYLPSLILGLVIDWIVFLSVLFLFGVI